MRLLFAPALLLILALTTSAQTKATRPPLKVQLRVSSSDLIKGEVTSYVSRELRQFKDVQITDNDPIWTISIVAMEVSSRTGSTKLGVVLSVVITTPFSKAAVYNIAKTVEGQKFLDLYVDGYEMVRGHWLRTGSLPDLRQVCVEIVADFDGEYLEETRKIYDSIYK